MVRKKVDPRVRALLEESVRLCQRAFVVVVGDHGKDQVVNLHLMLSKTRVKALPSVLWCYKKEVRVIAARRRRAVSVSAVPSHNVIGLLCPALSFLDFSWVSRHIVGSECGR